MKPIRCFPMIKKDSNMICIEKDDSEEVLEVLISEDLAEVELSLIFEILEICSEVCFEDSEVDLEREEKPNEMILKNTLKSALRKHILELKRRFPIPEM